MIKILFICHGNICRSTMSEYVMKYLTDQAGLASEFYIDSAATSREEIGNGVHHGTRQKLKEVGIPCGNHKARQMMRRDYEEFDYIIGMDASNVSDLRQMCPQEQKHKIYAFASESVPDPWYTGDFEATWKDVTEGCQGLLEYILK